MKILIFGAGFQGKKYLEDIEKGNDERTVVGFLDNDPQKCGGVVFDKYPCYHPEKVRDLKYDRIIIANNTSKVVRSDLEMHAQLLSLGVSEESIGLLFTVRHETKPTLIITEADKSYYQKRFDFFKELAQFIKDNGINGNVAECGVFLGDTAGYMNLLYPDRKLYLFDTFEGFTKQDVEAEMALGDEKFMSNGNIRIGSLGNTSIDIVMEKMSFPENVVLKKGRVPQTYAQVDDIFCFVHLDMDLYQPTLAACKFFWDKMDVNGVIVLHDYYNQVTPGIKKAVDDFEANLGRKIPKLPVPGADMVLIKD